MCSVLLQVVMYRVSSLVSSDMGQDLPIWRASSRISGARACLQVLTLTYTHAYIHIQYLFQSRSAHLFDKITLTYVAGKYLFHKRSKPGPSMLIECPWSSEYENTFPHPSLRTLGFWGLRNPHVQYVYPFPPREVTKMGDRNSKQCCFLCTTAPPSDEPESDFLTGLCPDSWDSGPGCCLFLRNRSQEVGKAWRSSNSFGWPHFSCFSNLSLG